MCILTKIIVHLVVLSAVFYAYETAQQFTQRPSSDKLVYPGQTVYQSGVSLPLTQQNHPTDEDYDDELGQQPLTLNSEKQETSHNISEIPLDIIREINDNKYTINDLLLRYVDDYDDFVESRFGEDERDQGTIPTTADCMPEFRTINLVDNKDPTVLYIPYCTRIEQCGGCCNSDLFECQPTEVESINFKVLRATYKKTDSNKLSYSGKEIITLERHKKCKCSCKLKPVNCSPMQVYEEKNCQCNCRNTDEEKKCFKEELKRWNPNTCSCDCRQEMACTTGSVFDKKQCKCVVKQVRRRNVDQQRRYHYRHFALPVIPLRYTDNL